MRNRVVMHKLFEVLGAPPRRLEELESVIDQERAKTLRVLEERQRLTREATHAARSLRLLLQSEFMSELTKAQRYLRRNHR